MVELDSFDDGARIHYAIDDWELYESPIEIDESTHLRFYAELDGVRSPVVEAYLHRIPNDWTIELEGVPNQQYTAGGPEALIDGLRGRENWRTGGWIGFQFTDFTATVDLQEIHAIQRAGASFLQDQRSWIWMPVEVTISVSTDGESFIEVGRLTTDVAEDAKGIVLRDMTAALNGVEGRYVMIEAKSFGTIPDWHLGSGGGAFIFMDEIIVE
jgi:hypothetical protein